jgi:hypothetical protein
MKMYNKRPSLYTFDGDNGTQGLRDTIQRWNLVTNFIVIKEVNPKLISTKRFFHIIILLLMYLKASLEKLFCYFSHKYFTCYDYF